MYIENPMILPEVEYHSQSYYDSYYEAMAEKEDAEYEDYF